MDIKKLWRLKRVNSDKSWAWRKTFIGKRMQHNFWLYPTIDLLLLENKQIRCIVEIGTGHGCLTTVLGLWGAKLGIPVWSIDHKLMHNKEIFNALHIHFHQVDQYSKEACAYIMEHINDEPVFLVCDGGNKPWEFRTFVPLLPVGSIIGVHDWGCEIDYDHPEFGIRGVVEKYCEPFMEDNWSRLNVQFATFKKVSSGI